MQREYFQWVKVNSLLTLPSSFNTIAGLPDSLAALAKNAIDSYISEALQEASAPLAQAALELAGQFEPTDFFQDPADDALYSTEAVKRRLGYEVRIERAEIFGEADNALVQAIVGVYLKDPNNADPDAPKVRSSINTEIDVEFVPLGFRLTDARLTTLNGIASQKAHIVQGDANLEVVLRATDRHAQSELVRVTRTGRYQFSAGVRTVSDADLPDSIPETVPYYFSPLADSLSIYSGESAIVEGRVTQGFSPVPLDVAAIDFRITQSPPGPPPTIEQIDGSRLRITPVIRRVRCRA